MCEGDVPYKRGKPPNKVVVEWRCNVGLSGACNILFNTCSPADTTDDTTIICADTYVVVGTKRTPFEKVMGRFQDYTNNVPQRA